MVSRTKSATKPRKQRESSNLDYSKYLRIKDRFEELMPLDELPNVMKCELLFSGIEKRHEFLKRTFPNMSIVEDCINARPKLLRSVFPLVVEETELKSLKDMQDFLYCITPQVLGIEPNSTLHIWLTNDIVIAGASLRFDPEVHRQIGYYLTANQDENASEYTELGKQFAEYYSNYEV